MATILLVEDRPDLGLYERKLLERAGHRVIWCGGGPTSYAACPMLSRGACPLADSADMLLFSCAMSMPMRGRSYRAEHLLNAYRTHPRYGKLPTVVVSIGAPQEMMGTGPYTIVDKFSSPSTVVDTIGSLLGEGRAAGAESKAMTRILVARGGAGNGPASFSAVTRPVGSCAAVRTSRGGPSSPIEAFCSVTR